MGEKETLMKYMGEKSGIYGILFSLLLGGIAAGPSTSPSQLQHYY